MQELIINNENYKQVLDSREVAEMMEKRHADLMRDIRVYKEHMEDNADLHSQNFFIESTYKNSQNKEQPCYLLTKKGCEFVANKMTGAKGTLFTAKYIERFHAMDNIIKEHIAPKTIDSFMIEDPIARAKRWIEEQEEKMEIKGVLDAVTTNVVTVDKFNSQVNTFVKMLARHKGKKVSDIYNILYTGLEQKLGIRVAVRQANEFKRFNKELAEIGLDELTEKQLKAKGITKISTIKESEFESVLELIKSICVKVGMDYKDIIDVSNRF